MFDMGNGLRIGQSSGFYSSSLIQNNTLCQILFTVDSMFSGF